MNSNIKVHEWKSLSKANKNLIIRRSQVDIDFYYKKVIPIIEDVKKRGDQALVEYNKKFDKVEIPVSKLEVKPAEFLAAEKLLSKEVKLAIETAYKNIFNFHKLLKTNKSMPFSEITKGILIREASSPIDSVGLYIPRGKGSFPSMVNMLAIPAMLAGVPKRIMVSPPLENGTIDPACLYAAKLSHVHHVFKVGGAQAIAALAFGTKKIPPVVKIIGPGSAFVSAAKRYVSSYVDIGLPAGPSESIILADATSPAELVAYDLCIEAEHGKDSMAILLTHKKDFAQSIAMHLNKIIAAAPQVQKEILLEVFTKYKGIILTKDLDESIEICNTIAPEHLMIHSDSPSTISPKIRNAGEILLGKNSPFSIANYAAGNNAVIPTGGLAKSFSPVSINDFVKHSSIIHVTEKGLSNISSTIQTLAEYEGFYFHKKAIDIRTNKN